MATARSPAHLALGRSVREFRDALGLSQEELAHRSGLHRNYIGGIERGELNPSFASLLQLTEALEIRFSLLIARFEELSEQT